MSPRRITALAVIAIATLATGVSTAATPAVSAARLKAISTVQLRTCYSAGYVWTPGGIKVLATKQCVAPAFAAVGSPCSCPLDDNAQNIHTTLQGSVAP